MQMYKLIDWAISGLAAIAILTIGIVVGGLAPAQAQFAAGERKEPAITSYKIEHLGNVLEFKLVDGTRCVVVQKSGSITCEWK